MRIVFFVHAIASCWNNGNAHFLRGVVTALQDLGHEVLVHEPRAAWSRENLVADHGEAALEGFAAEFPTIRPRLYGPDPDLAELTDAADLVIVHEWNDPHLVNALGRLRARSGDFLLLFHDTHHRAATRPEEMLRFDLSGYDGILAFGGAIADLYRNRGWSGRCWTWHEAADTRIFYPRRNSAREGELCWIGNWGDDERSAELHEFLLQPARELGLSGNVYGVRYPSDAVAALAESGLAYRGWLPNHRAPDVFAAHDVTVHVPRRPYATALPGIPTIRVFEALACGIPLVSAPWQDSEGLFPPDCYLSAADGASMTRLLRDVLNDPELAATLRANGLAAIRDRHTCDHRARELLDICAGLRSVPETEPLRKAV